MSATRNREPMKVVIINTQYVETDAMSFRSVVQRLTGKDSKVDAAPCYDGSSKIRPDLGISGGDPVLSREMSFKELEKLLNELPPLEELHRLWSV